MFSCEHSLKQATHTSSSDPGESKPIRDESNQHSFPKQAIAHLLTQSLRRRIMKKCHESRDTPFHIFKRVRLPHASGNARKIISPQARSSSTKCNSGLTRFEVHWNGHTLEIPSHRLCLQFSYVQPKWLSEPKIMSLS